MTRRSSLVLGLLGSVLLACAGPQPRAVAPEESPKLEEAQVRKFIVRIRAYTQRPDWRRPWKRQRPTQLEFDGILLDKGRVLFANNNIQSMSLVEVQRSGGQEWYKATLEHIDHDIALGLLKVEDARFWEGARGLQVSDAMPRVDEDVDLVDFGTDRPDIGKGKFSGVTSITVERIPVPALSVNSGMSDLGDGDAILYKNKLIGVAQQSRKGGCYALTGALLKDYLRQVEGGSYKGYGRAGIWAQDLSNPVLRKHLGLKNGEGGVRIIRVEPASSAEGVLRVGDVVLAVDGLVLDPQGFVQHPRWGRVPMRAVWLDGRHAGDAVKVRVLREGKRDDVALALRRTLASDEKVPANMLGSDPEYFVYAGLVFQTLNATYLRAQGRDGAGNLWNTLLFEEERTEAHPRVVILSEVLPDAVNLGYQDMRNLVVVSVNGKPIRLLDDVKAALKAPAGEFQIVEFEHGLARIVLDAKEADASNGRIPLN